MEIKKEFLEGEVWSLLRKKDYLVQISKLQGNIFHISVLFIDEEIIMHLPISKAKFVESVDELIRVDIVKKNNLKVINDWEKDSGGVWDLLIEEILDELLG